MNVELSSRLVLALQHMVGDVLGHSCPTGFAPRPAAYALQALMRNAAVAGDTKEMAKVYESHGDILLARDATPRLRVVPLPAAVLSPSERAVLQAGFQDDIGLTENLVEPTPQDYATVAGIIEDLKRSLPAALPLWSQELEELVDTIVLAASSGTEKVFAGASAFDVWGAILVNPAYRSDRLHLAMTLVHESSHLKLFYAYLDDEIVLNAPDDRYASPLRRQPRPMNGIYHAAFVLARMARFIADALQAGVAETLFGDNATAVLEAELRNAVTHFDAAHSVITQHGLLSPKGAQIIAEAAAEIEQCRTRLQAS
jgi:hypothetical protein